MDEIEWHTEDITEEFNKVSVIKLPLYSPELNLIEQVSSMALVKTTLPSQPSFTDYEDIVAKVCDAWNRF